MPYFLLIVLGVIFRRTGLVSREFFGLANRFTFRVALPFQLFCNISQIDNNHPVAKRFMLFVLLVTLLSFVLIWAVTELIYRKQKHLIGTLVQGAFRGNFVLLGAPIAASVLGDGAMQFASLTSIIVIPTYNILSVVVLIARGKSDEPQSISRVIKGIATNPLIIGIFCAIPIMLLQIKLPTMVAQTLTYVGQTGTPLGLLSIGGMLTWGDATKRIRPALYSALIKNFILPACVMALSYQLGFRGEELLVLLVMCAAPVAISTYSMAAEMGGDAPLASNILILSTLFSGFTLAVGIYLLKTLSLI